MSSNNEKALPTSRTWKAMKKGMDIFDKGTWWSASRDSIVKFWLEFWTTKGPLRLIIHGPFSKGEEVFKIKDIVSKLGWDWRKIFFILPNDIVKEIRAMPHACVASEEDGIIWAVTLNGQFSLNSAYLLKTQNLDSFQPFNGSWIWKIKTLPRIQTFIWMCFHNSIATRVCIASRGMQVNLTCLICHQAPESIIHVLRDCYLATSCWQNLGVNLGCEFFSLDSREWLKKYCRWDVKVGPLLIPWNLLFSFGLWTIWQHRNGVVFQNRTPNQAIHSEVT